MNERIENLKKYTTIDKSHRKYRKSSTEAGLAELPEDFRASGMGFQERAGNMLAAFLDAETPVLLPEEKIVFTRTIKDIPDYVTPSEWQDIRKSHFVHEKGEVFNISADFEGILNKGLEARRLEAEKLAASSEGETKIFAESVEKVLAALQRLIGRYADAAEKLGKDDIAKTLRAVQKNPASSFREALQLLRAVHFAIWASGSYHNTLGRLDQYLYPFYKSDVESGKISKDEAFELLEEFFLACNRDSDLYPGMQQGDNGQSMVLGGCDENGDPAFNELSEMCLTASEELKIIDPKINLRVNKSTPLKVYERGTRLTRQGLGFPQYSNDDVVIDALVDWGYDLKDARNYTVAACWEFIVPRFGADIPNIGVMNFPLVVDRAVRKHLASSADFDEFLGFVECEIKDECDFIIEDCNKRYTPYSVFTSAFILPCIEKGRDVSKLGAKYNNFGVHGAGIANAADALAAIKKEVFEKKELSSDELIAALDADFEGYGDVRRKLLDSPKMGNNDDYVDNLGAFLMDKFALYLSKKPNNRGGIYRAGTGSAMEYVLSAAKVGATADGRRARQAYGSSFSPSLDAVIQGPLSAVQSFTKADLKKVCNGGPFTIEIHDTVFRNPEGEKKTAALIKTFIDLGGHQIQINAINRDKLIDAQKHPEKYPNLIVRVWGWSGYFRELDACYQNHIIRRTEFGF